MTPSPEAILAEYENRPRALSTDFIRDIPWGEIPRHPLPANFVPVLTYMRNIERFTEVYFRELQRSPTGRDPIVRRFMERWNEEEAQHGELLERFLAEAGYPSGENWFEGVISQIPWRYTAENYVYSLVTKLIGTSFSGVHMTWGAINELATLQGYRRLIERAGHPVLTQILRGIMQEESTHIFFYFNIARHKLQASRFSRRLARGVIDRFWQPVGHGIRPATECDYVLRALFQGEAGGSALRRHVNDKIAQLPGFQGFNTVATRVSERLSDSGETGHRPKTETNLMLQASC
jgi:hypothetical protein